MCNAACLKFGLEQLSARDVQGKDVLEVGSMNVNGSLRAGVTELGPRSYVGVDIAKGPGVDLVCRAEDLLAEFGEQRFDVVLCTEVVEHVRDWRLVLGNLKRLLRADGVLLVTTRSAGFPYHGYPHDYWRYESEDVRAVFGDLSELVIETDPCSPGVFVKGRRPRDYVPADMTSTCLYSMLLERRARDVTDLQVLNFRVGHALEIAKHVISQMLKRPIDRLWRRSPAAPPGSSATDAR